MARLIVLPFLAYCLLSFGTMQAQTSANPWMAGLSAIFLDYQGPLTGDITQYKTFNPGISFGAHAYLNGLMNVSLNSSFVPQTQYPLAENTLLSTSLIDVNGLVQFKSNGTIFSEEAFFAPYISTGFGLNSASNNVRLYIPAALGFRFRFNKNFSIQLESMYKQALGKEKYQHISHSAGFVFALPSQRRPVKKPPKPPVKKDPKPQIAINDNLPDSDGDGVPDRDDLCPDVKGKSMFLGCPEKAEEEKKEEIAGKIIDTSEDVVTLEPEESGKTKVEIDDANRIDIRPADQNFLDLAMDNVYFDVASNELMPESYPVLDTVALILQRYPQYNLEVMGHTDNTGSNKGNTVLSIMRAFKVKYYLVYEKDISIARINSDGYSSAVPLADNLSEDGRKMNRRVEFKLVKSSPIQNRVGMNQTY